MEILLQHTGKGFMTMLMISMPVVLSAAGIGLVVGVLQAVTQIQEQTISAAPKIVGVFIVIMALSGYFMNMLEGYMIQSTILAFEVIPKEGNYVLTAGDEVGNFSSFKKPTYGDLMRNPAKTGFAPNRTKPSYTPATRPQTPQPNIVEAQKLYNGR